MRVSLSSTSWEQMQCDALIVPFFEDESSEDELPAALNQRLEGLLDQVKTAGEWKGKFGEILTLHRPPGLRADRLILLGAGKRDSYEQAAVKRLMMLAMYRVKEHELQKVAVYRRSRLPLTLAVQAAVEGLVLGSHQIDEYKTQRKSKSFGGEIILLSEADGSSEEYQEAIRRGEVLAQATNMARSLVNEPGNRVNPAQLAAKARDIAEKYNLQVDVLGEPEMEEKGMNAVLAVARGSDEAAQFIVLRHFGAADSEEQPLVFVGKGVTFDSGGLSLKPARSMEDMKTDKAGACAVLGAMQAIAQLQVGANVVGLIPAVENLPSGRAQRPGDIIRSMSGKTIEVLDTDAEGRLILADALHYATLLNPRFIVDFATLTGSVVVALGFLRAGLFSNDDQLVEEFLEAAERSGEKFWRLPLDDEYRKELDSRIADIKNIGSRWAGAVTAAKFLEEFVGKTPWLHVDMAGLDSFPDTDDIKGPTGFGVRTLAELALGSVSATRS
jgi:leucyl aminopeptidase